MKKYLLRLLIVILLFSNYYAFAEVDSTILLIDNEEHIETSDTIYIDEQTAKKERFLLASPYLSIKLFIEYLQVENFKPELSARALNVKNISIDDKIEIAVKIKRIIDARGLIVEFDKLPRDENYIDSITGESKYILFERLPEIYLEKIGNKWMFSAETIEIIDDLYSKVFPFEIEHFKDIFPEFSFNTILGVEIWKIMGLIVLLFFTWILFLIFHWITGYFIVRIFSKYRREDLATRFIKPVSKPFSLLINTLLLIQFLPILEFPVKANLFILNFLHLVIPILGIWILNRIIDLLSDIGLRLASKTQTTVDDHLVPFARKALKGLVFIIGCFYILRVLDIDYTPLLAGVSIGGLALALAAQDTVKNIFGSITIFTDKPFQVGEWIVFQGGEGTVEEIGLRSTRIRTFYNSVISIPNGRLADITIDNMGKREYRRFSTNIAITYDTPVELIEAFIDGLNQVVKEHPLTYKNVYHIYLNNFADHSLNILFYIFFAVPDWGKELYARQSVMLEIIKLAESLGIRFAFPTQTVHIEDFPEKISMSPNYERDKEKLLTKIKEHFAQNKRINPSTDA